MDLVIVTGMSGAGKSQVVDALEDMGYYCVDNVPPSLLPKFAELPQQSHGQINRVALVVDMRSRELFSDFVQVLDELQQEQYGFKTLFLDCEDRVLMKRYKETRRRHPLLSGNNGSTQAAITEERLMLSTARDRADFILDTSLITSSQLKNRVRELFADGTGQAMHINCMSFGFKFGIPADADLVFDVRCLPNPFYVEELREKTGLDAPVREYVLRFEQAKELVPRLLNLIDYLIPLYVQEGKSQLVIAIGCTGGKHRSVTFAELLGAHLGGQGLPVQINHRDILVKR